MAAKLNPYDVSDINGTGVRWRTYRKFRESAFPESFLTGARAPHAPAVAARVKRGRST